MTTVISSKYKMRKFFINFPIFITTSVLTIYFFMNLFWFLFTEPKPSNIPLLQKIESNELDCRLELYYDNINNFYWLYSIQKNNKKRLIMYDGNIRGKIEVKVYAKNIIELKYDYFEDSFKKDTSIFLDLSKNDTHRITFIRKILSLF